MKAKPPKKQPQLKQREIPNAIRLTSIMPSKEELTKHQQLIVEDHFFMESSNYHLYINYSCPDWKEDLKELEKRRSSKD